MTKEMLTTVADVNIQEEMETTLIGPLNSLAEIVAAVAVHDDDDGVDLDE